MSMIVVDLERSISWQGVRYPAGKSVKVPKDAIRAAGIAIPQQEDPESTTGDGSAPLSKLVEANDDNQNQDKTGDGEEEQDGERLDLNSRSLTAAQLDELPSVGPVYAKTILQVRPVNGFESFEEFKEICSEIGLRLIFDQLEHLVSFGKG